MPIGTQLTLLPNSKSCSLAMSGAEHSHRRVPSVPEFDWASVARDVVRVYEAVLQPGVKVRSGLQRTGLWAVPDDVDHHRSGHCLLIIFGVYLASTAGRLDRLHHRVDTAYASLNEQLLRRSAIALKSRCRASWIRRPVSFWQMRQFVPRRMRAIQLIGPNLKVTSRRRLRRQSEPATRLPCSLKIPGRQLGNQLSAALHRASISRRFYNDAVRACRAVRRQHL